MVDAEKQLIGGGAISTAKKSDNQRLGGEEVSKGI